MAVKHFVDEIPPSTGRVYQIQTNGQTSTITDVTQYSQEGSGFGAADVNAACVLECNYVKNNHTHQLITPNGTSENIKFFATAAYERGDVFTFNGASVTAKTFDGEELDDGFFKANTLVECFLKGDVLYFAGHSKTIKDNVEGTSYRLGIENGILYIEED